MWQYQNEIQFLFAKKFGLAILN